VTDDLVIGYEEFTTRQRMKTYKATDVAMLQSMVKVFAEGANVLAEYVLNLADRIAAIKIATGTNVIYAGTGNTQTSEVAAGDVVTSALIKRAVALLEGGNVPRFEDGFYRCILHPYVKFDVELDDEVGGWIDAQRYAGSTNLFSGEIGKYAGVRFITSTNARVKAASGTSSIDVYSTTIFGPRFFAMGDFGNNETFVTPPGGHDDPGHQSALITWKGWVDAMVVGEGDNATNVSDPRYIRIESASTI
jgi:N4-gp56 family major capsid protein